MKFVIFLLGVAEKILDLKRGGREISTIGK